MSALIDETGKQFARWTVLHKLPKPGTAMWVCRCSCGNSGNTRGADLRRGQSQSCGCLRIEKQITHDQTQTREYQTWKAMKQRCHNSKWRDYPGWGGRGIKVCNRWVHSFENFLVDMGKRPQGKQLDRINNDGNYEPNNCRWATRSEQQKNKRSKILCQ